MTFAPLCPQGLDGAPYDRFETLVKQFQRLVSKNYVSNRVTGVYHMFVM